MKRPLKVTLKIVAVLAIVAGSIAVGPGWWTLIGFFSIIAIVILGEWAEWISNKKGWGPFGGPWPRRRRDDEEAVPQLTEGDNNETKERP